MWLLDMVGLMSTAHAHSGLALLSLAHRERRDESASDLMKGEAWSGSGLDLEDFFKKRS